MPNPSGSNGHQNGTRPSDDRLREVLHELARRNLSLALRLDYLEKKEGYKIGKTKLKELNHQFNVPTVRKPPPLPVATTIVSKTVAQDIAGQNGPSTIQQIIRNGQGVQIPRDTVRAIMHDNYPHGAEARFPGKQVPRPRGLLKLGEGIFQEVHCDGHEKMNAKALRMGPISIDIYGMRCHSSGKILHEFVVPNAQCSSTIGHIYLDFVSKYGKTCEQLTVDGGSETGEMYACHIALRDKYMPNSTKCGFVALPSTKNIGYFQSNDELHVNLFNWIWPKIVQAAVDEFIDYWNNHKTRTQHKANLPTGVAPNVIFDFPQNYGLVDYGVQVDLASIVALRETIPKTRDECYRWVPDDFNLNAGQAYTQLGSPKLSHTNGWQVFIDMLSILSAV
ncbi:hypothetical protein F5050DRAFT_1801932 [Lentinula boryana]|uniref:Uncharacterized protein n=1 Tax=Lentinula boryana TaxID=40481 RepID=A0ABQ8PZS5_9AGAR|nr:hypothetical protein F5050DRAFT_1801932 [Lentinula boryana]